MQEISQEKSPIKQRISLFLKKSNIRPSDFYKISGVTRGVLGQNNGISEDNLSRFVSCFPEVNIVWLITGEGEMLNHTKAKIPKDPQSQEISQKRIASPIPANEARIPMKGFYAEKQSGIPLVPVDAMAGYFAGDVSLSESDCERIIVPGLKADFVIHINGDSMEPLYYSGDYVACQRIESIDLFFQWGKVYVIDTSQGILLKKIKRAKRPNYIMLVSENSEYDPIEVPLSEVYHIALVKALVRVM